MNTNKFKPIYIPISLTIIILILAVATGFSTGYELLRSSLENTTSLRGMLPVFFLLIIPLSLLLLCIAGFAYLGIIIGIWVFYGICVLVVRLIRKYLIPREPDDDFPEENEYASGDYSSSLDNQDN